MSSNPYIVSDEELLVESRQVANSQPTIHQHPQWTDDFDLPEIDQAMTLVNDESVTIPTEIVEGLLHKGLKGIIGSNSKARKTWILLDMALSVATGTKFWKWNTVKGKVLFINFEIKKPFLRTRLLALAAEKQLTDYNDLHILTLRGHGGCFDETIEAISRKIASSDYSLVIIDPIYKGLNGKNENDAGDIGELCNQLELLTEETGAAVLYAHHFSKGNQAGKQPIDRFSGSGVFARDADTIVVMTQHEEDSCYTVEVELRNLPEQQPFVVKWNYPVMKIDETADPKDLKGRSGSPKKWNKDELLDLLKPKPMKRAEWFKLAKEELGIKESSFDRERKELKKDQKVVKSKDHYWRVVEDTDQTSTPTPPTAPASTEPIPPASTSNNCQPAVTEQHPKP